MTSTITASPTKLRSGAWGARVNGSVRRGDTITIRTRSGKTWKAKITRVVWSGSGVSICATESLDRSPRRGYRPRRGYGYDCCGGICPVRGHRCSANNPCHDCE